MTRDPLVRFTVGQRLEHLAVVVLFTVLVVTGAPQKFYQAEWARTLLIAMGGVTWTRTLHHLAGVLFALVVVVHLIQAVWGRRRALGTIAPQRKDFSDAIQMLRYYVGTSKRRPRFDRFDYRQKFVYWGLLFGALVMMATGFILLYPIPVAKLLPGELIPIAKVTHSNEGLVTFLVVIVWHIFNAHLNPDVFPLDTSIFTGRISRKRMQREHPLELERLEATERKEMGD
jgi:cytochrome b subunit of formate dehydrogenase